MAGLENFQSKGGGYKDSVVIVNDVVFEKEARFVVWQTVMVVGKEWGVRR